MATFQLKSVITDILSVNIDSSYQLDDDITECWFVLQNFAQYFNSKVSRYEQSIQIPVSELSIPDMENYLIDYVDASSTGDELTDQQDFIIEDITEERKEVYKVDTDTQPFAEVNKGILEDQKELNFLKN